MTMVTQPLREEHRELLPRIEDLRQVADAVGAVTPDELRRQVDDVHDFLAKHLIPHAQAEDEVLYPAVGKAMGAPQATATMSREHVEVGRLTEELRALRLEMDGEGVAPKVEMGVRRVLYGLYALVKVHFAEEEEIYLPILDARLSPEEAGEMFELMESAAVRAKRAV